MREDEKDAQFVALPDCQPQHIIEVSAMDRYMSMKNDSEAIGVKKCPKCSTPIKTCLRYSHSIKSSLQDIGEGQKLQLSKTISSETLKEHYKKTVDSVKTSTNYQFISNEFSKIESKVFSKHPLLFPEVIQTQLTILPHIVKAIEIVSAPDNALFEERIESFKQQLHTLKSFVAHTDYLSKQQISDAEAETQRLTLLAHLTDFQIKAQKKKVSIHAKDHDLIQKVLAQLQDSGKKGPQMKSTVPKITPENEITITESIQNLYKKYEIDVLTQAEKLEIVNAIGLSKGHWFKCPNGHIYCIGECGGAMETAKCPECKADIGGGRHVLLPTNQLASEMDGATYPAFSDMANMQNFDPQELALLQFGD